MRADLLQSLRLQFARRHADDARKLGQAIQDKSHEQIRDLSHEIRGDAGNLGMAQLAHLSYQLEGAGRSGQIPEHALFSAWQEELSRILTELQTLQKVSSQADNQPLDTDRMQELLRRLLGVLEVDLQEAFTCLQEMGEVVEATSAVSRYEGLREGLEEFEIDLVRHQSEEWLKELSWTVQTNPGSSS